MPDPDEVAFYCLVFGMCIVFPVAFATLIVLLALGVL